MVDILSLSRFDLLAAAVQLVVASSGIATAIIYFSKRSGNWSSNIFFALLVSGFALSIITLVCEHLGLPAKHQRLRYLPLWFTWLIGPSWFYYIKFSLFPSYRFRLTDIKHFILPVVQWSTYCYMFVSYAPKRGTVEWMGIRATTIEELIFLLSVFGYLLLSYRYLRYRASEIGNSRLRWDFWKIRLLRRSQRVLVVLLVFNFFFVALNFATLETLGTGLLHLRGFYASSSLSFGIILVYLLRGVAYRQHFSPQVPASELEGVRAAAHKRLSILIDEQQGYRDPDLHRVRVARSIGVPPEELDRLQPNFERWIRNLRFAEISRLRKSGLSLRNAALEAGFSSRRAALRAYERRQS